MQDVLEPDDHTKRCDLLLALGQALMPAGEPERVSDEIASQALAQAERAGDATRVARVSRLALEALHRRLAALAPALQRGGMGRAGRCEPADPAVPERAYADVRWDGSARSAAPRRGRHPARTGVELARELGDAELFATAGWQAIRFQMTSGTNGGTL